MSSGSGSEQASGSYNGDSMQESGMSGITDRYGSNIMDEPGDQDQVEGTASKEASFEEKEATGASELNKYLSVYDQTFDKIQIPPDVVEEVQNCLAAFITLMGSKEAAGEAIYSAVFEAAPSLQVLFKTPRSVIALRFVTALSSLVYAAGKPGQLKTQVETIGFQHLDIEVSSPRVDIFREAILELFDQELGPRLTDQARFGFQLLLNYTGGALIYIRREYASRIRIIQTSWKSANKKAAGISDVAEPGEMKTPSGRLKGKSGEMGDDNDSLVGDADGEGVAITKQTDGMMVPSSFNDMFLFNAAVMGLTNHDWMTLILDQLDAIANNVANPYRLQEECDVLALVLSKYQGTFVLSEFKAVVLASLRSLVSTEWDSDHEVAWNWLWQNVERLLKQVLGKPPVHEKALSDLFMSLPEASMAAIRQEFFLHFFKVAPAGSDFFKQSSTRLYFIADKIIELTLEMYRQPRAMVEDISGLGLRHVGYSIPSELFSPFVTSAVDVFRRITTSETAIAGFQWSLTLVSKILVRAISEGSTVVMKAISTNDEISLKKGMALSPRGKRAQDLLNISVGAQSISPFYWSIKSGNFNSAKAILDDLLTIRADRDVYYFACDDLFTRHPDVVQFLITDVPVLLRPLFSGLVWRSRWINKGTRRVNYYVKHLVQDLEGNPNETLSWLEEHGDPDIISHPAVVFFSDILWDGISKFHFLRGRVHFLISFIVFLVSQSVLSAVDDADRSEALRIALFSCRIFIYAFCMMKMIFDQIRMFCADCRGGYVERYCRIPIPHYLQEWQGLGGLILLWLLIIMATQEPMFWCLGGDETLFTTACAEGLARRRIYSVFSSLAMILFWGLLVNLSVFSMRISAFILVCGRVLSEVGLFLLAFVFIILASASSISALEQGGQSDEDFSGIPSGSLTLAEIALNIYSGTALNYLRSDMVLLFLVYAFCILVTIFLVSLLVAQLNQAYQHGFKDMQGFARLNRVHIIVYTLENMSNKSWTRFLESLHFDERLEFNEGDVGVAGGIQVLEPASQHPTSVESIRRYGGSTAPTMPWPEEPGDYGQEDKFEKLEKLIIRTTKNLNKGREKHRRPGGQSGASSMAMSDGSSNKSGSSDEESS
eukprot:s1403_g4.t1